MSRKSGSKNRIYNWWLGFTLKQKFSVFAGSVVCTITFAVLINILVVNFALYGFGTILDDNAQCYSFLEAIEQEMEAFDIFVRKQTPENQKQYEAACENTEESLDDLPFSYEEMGESRYARTWSIFNAYEAYREAREEVISMETGGKEYVTALYRVYDMQAYLKEYAQGLIQLTLQEGNQDYLDKVPLLQFLPYWLLFLGIVLVIVIFYMTNMMRRSTLLPIERLVHASRKITSNDFSGEDVEVENKDEMGELVHVFNKMKRATEGYITTLKENQEIAGKLHREELERVEMEKILEATRLEVLKSQINPHFLFNTLNTIACMARLEDAKTTEKMITSMSNLFRYNLKTTETKVLLSRELKIVEDYLYIQQTRFGDRLQYKKWISVDENQVIIPSFSLQPIVENAIIHGISKKEQGGKIQIRIGEKEGKIIISVVDSGVGMSKERLRELWEACKERRTSKIGIGLGNIYKRLHMMYEGAELAIYSKEGMGTVVQMKIPENRE